MTAFALAAVRLIADGSISGKQAKEVFARMYETSETAASIVEALGISQITDSAVIVKPPAARS